MSSFPLLIPTLLLLSLSTNPTFSISTHFPNPNPISDHSLSGDAHFSGAGVQLTLPTPSSSGIILNKTPFNFTPSTSLSSHFTFQIGNVVSLVIIPNKLVTNMSLAVDNRLLGIEFYPNVVKISGDRVCNVSKSYVVKEGVKVTAWVSYRAVTKRLEVMVSKFGDTKVVELLVSVSVDLGEVLKGGEVLLGLVGWNEGNEGVSYVYAWSSEVEDVPKWVHSIPVNPDEPLSVGSGKGKGGVDLGLGFGFASGCGVLVALVMLFVWAYVGGRKEVEGGGLVGDVGFKYEKIDVVEVKGLGMGMK